jgi:hypothetical protein
MNWEMLAAIGQLAAAIGVIPFADLFGDADQRAE